MEKEIITAIIAAASVLSGVIISQAISLLLTFLNRRHEKHKLLRQKYEEMMLHFSDSLRWLQDLHCCKTRDEIFAQAQSLHSRKVISLCLLYFPDLVEKANEYIQAQQEYYSFVAHSFNDTLPINAGGQAFVHQAGKNLADALFRKKIELENQIVKKVPKYIKA